MKAFPSKLLYKVAELLVDIPNDGGLGPRCRDYLWESEIAPQIVISTEKYDPTQYSNDMPEEQLAYMESGRQFYSKLIDFEGFYLNSSAVELEGRAYLFSGPCGTGKSTHTRLWQSTFGEAAQVFNDDKPALRRREGRWYAYGTPWCGKDGINQNKKVPLAGICFLKQADHNSIRRLSKEEAIQKILSQTFHKFKKVERLDKMLTLLDQIVREIPVYELENRPEPEAAKLSYETMRRGAEEYGL